MRTTFLILVITALSISVTAQDEITRGKSTFEIRIGINALGPAPKMADMMREFNFGYVSAGFILGFHLRKNPSDEN